MECLVGVVGPCAGTVDVHPETRQGECSRGSGSGCSVWMGVKAEADRECLGRALRKEKSGEESVSKTKELENKYVLTWQTGLSSCSTRSTRKAGPSRCIECR